MSDRARNDHRHEYRVVPAPVRGRKAPGVKTAEGRFALGVEDVLNEMAASGWRYLRSDILPSEERQGLTSSTTVYRSVLVFEREVAPGDGPLPDDSDASAAETPPLVADRAEG